MTQDKLRATLKKAIQDYSDQYIQSSFDPNNPKVKLHEPTYGAEEIWEALDSLLTTQVTMGKKVLGFEEALQSYFGIKNAIVNNSGSSANLLALAALANPAYSRALKPGDEVIVPALCWSTTLWPVIQMGLVPVIVDVDPVTFNIDPKEIEKAISPKTKAIIPVHVYGNPCDMAAIQALAEKHSLLVMEDCCEALGASFNGKPVSQFGDIGTYSFYFSHHITTLEGGVCLTQNDELAELMRVLRAHGWVREMKDKKAVLEANKDIDPKFLFVNVGYNLRATELQGGFGIPQLKKLKGFVETRSQNADFFYENLKRFSDVFDFQRPTPGGTHSWFGFPMCVKKRAPFTVAELRSFLSEKGIESRPIIAGNIAVQPGMKLYPHRVVGDLSVSNTIMTQGFTFGNHQGIGADARNYVVKTLETFLSQRLATTAK